MHTKAIFFHMVNHAPPLHSVMYSSTPLIKFLLIMTAQDILFKGTESYKGLAQLDCQHMYKSFYDNCRNSRVLIG